MRVSIVICTYNRNDLLQKCLQSLKTQTADKKDYELIVVDNAGTDETRKLAADFSARYIHEKKVGLSRARNTGWKNAEGVYISYIDDDSIAHKDWIKEIVNFSIKNNAQIFGGPYSYYTDAKVPKWYPIETAEFSLGSTQKEIDIDKEFLNGTNIIIKKDLLKKMNGFKENLGMKGLKMGFDEEVDFLRRSAKSAKIFYVPDIKVKHFLPKYKISILYLLKRNYLHGVNNKNNEGVFKLIKSFIYCPVLAFSKTDGFLPKKWLYYSLAEPISRIGSII